MKKQVFGSKAERENFYKLSRQWGDKYRIYHNLPFLNVFDTKDLIDISDWQSPKKIEISDIEYNRLKKTSIDYTLCDTEDAPLVCIEFDGLQDGFNIGTKYHAQRSLDEYSSIWRKEFMELKLKVAFGSLFPYFVVGSEHFINISPDIQLTVVDGIIGEVLARKASRDKFKQGFVPEEIGWSEVDFNALPPDEKHEIIQDWVMGVEVDADFEHNPIYQKCGELSEEIIRMPHRKYRFRVKHEYYPAIDHLTDIEERAKAIDSTILIGAKCTIETEKYGDVEGVVYLPDFKYPIALLSLTEEIAHLIALDKLRKLMSIDYNKSNTNK